MDHTENTATSKGLNPSTPLQVLKQTKRTRFCQCRRDLHNAETRIQFGFIAYTIGSRNCDTESSRRDVKPYHCTIKMASDFHKTVSNDNAIDKIGQAFNVVSSTKKLPARSAPVSFRLRRYLHMPYQHSCPTRSVQVPSARSTETCRLYLGSLQPLMFKSVLLQPKHAKASLEVTACLNGKSSEVMQARTTNCDKVRPTTSTRTTCHRSRLEKRLESQQPRVSMSALSLFLTCGRKCELCTTGDQWV